MIEEISKTSSPPFTHTAYLFVRTGVRKGRVYGYWKDGGRFREGEDPFAYIDMLPRGGWDGRIRFVRMRVPADREHQFQLIVNTHSSRW